MGAINAPWRGNLDVAPRRVGEFLQRLAEKRALAQANLASHRALGQAIYHRIVELSEYLDDW